MSTLNDRQVKFLGMDLGSGRTHTRSQGGRSFSYLEAWDIRRHLIRVFGYAGWSAEVLDAECVVDRPTETSGGKQAFQVAYRVTLRLSVPGATYTEVAVGGATLPDLVQAHDMAVKTAESDALKRAAVNLGTQFGLSLYNDGSGVDVVKWTLDGDAPEPAERPQDEPVAPEAVPEAESQPAAPESTATASSDGDPKLGTHDETLQALRDVYRLDTAAQKVKRLAEIKSGLDSDALTSTTQVRGETYTIERLIDKITSDAIAGIGA